MTLCMYDLGGLFDKSAEILVAKKATQSSLDVDNPEPVVTNSNWKVLTKSKDYITNTIQITLQEVGGEATEVLDLSKLSFAYACGLNEVSITSIIEATEEAGEIKNVYIFTFVGELNPAPYIIINRGDENGNCF